MDFENISNGKTELKLDLCPQCGKHVDVPGFCNGTCYNKFMEDGGY